VLNVTDDTTTNATFYPVFVSTTNTNTTPFVSTTKLYFNPSSGEISATDFNSLSDITYKTGLNTQLDSLTLLNRIQPYAFTWKDSGQKSYGVMAQELEQVLPELVKTNPSGAKTVSYLPLIAILIDAIKQLSNR
jgi:hypothetical protein